MQIYNDMIERLINLKTSPMTLQICFASYSFVENAKEFPLAQYSYHGPTGSCINSQSAVVREPQYVLLQTAVK